MGTPGAPPVPGQPVIAAEPAVAGFVPVGLDQPLSGQPLQLGGHAINILASRILAEKARRQ